MTAGKVQGLLAVMVFEQLFLASKGGHSSYMYALRKSLYVCRFYMPKVLAYSIIYNYVLKNTYYKYVEDIMAQAPLPSPAEPPASTQIMGGPPPEGVDRIPSFARSLSTLLRLLGRPVSMPLLLGGIMGGPSEGAPEACLRSAKKWGLSARIVHRKNVQDISHLTLPCILLLHNARSCVLLGFTEDTADIVLPEEGEVPKTVPLEELAAEYSGYAVFGALEGRLDARTHMHLPRFKRWFWDTIKHYLPLYKHVLIATVIINLVGVASSLFAMNVYDRVVPNQAVETLWVLATGVVFAYLVDFILRNVRGYFVDMAGRNADVILSSQLLHKVLTMRLETKPDSTGALANNLSSFESLREFFSSSSLVTLVDLPFLLIFLWLILFIGGSLVIVPLAAIPLMVGLSVLLQSLSRRAAEESYRQNMQKNALLIELINGLETVKTSKAESRLLFLWEQLADMSAEASSQSRRYSTLMLSVSSMINQLVSVGIIIWGVYSIMEGALTMGGLIACNILAGRAMAPLMQLAGMLSRLQQSRLALNALNTLMELPSEDGEGEEHVDFGLLQPAFIFDNVDFSYPSSKQKSLEGVSFTIRPHEKVGIVGKMGSGKSTIGRLMAGLYTPESGSVRYGGVDIRQMDTANLRGRIGFLPQDVVLFYGSIRDNIALGDVGIEDALVLRAAYLAGASDFIKNFPGGFGAQVGERGMALSGGQRQSIALARALLHDPEVLILDEPTSNMDKGTESLIKARLAKIIERKTVVLITHRPGMLDLMDRIIVIEDGKIVADGPQETVLHTLSASSLAQRKAQLAQNTGGAA